MTNHIKPGYINPLTMMKDNRKASHSSPDMLGKGEKKQKELEAEKQSIQNSLLLMKGTSGNGETSEENIKLLEKKLDEISNEIKTNRQEIAKNIPVYEKQAEEKFVMNSSFDTFIQKDQEEILGCYKVVSDDNNGYKILRV